MAVYNIAGLNVEMECKSSLLSSRCAAYISQGEPDMKVSRSDKVVSDMCALHPEMSHDEWEYMLYGTSFYRKLITFDGMLLHSSAVVVDGKAYLFSAPCGTGKSTHTELWLRLFGERAYIINDDKPAIRLIDGKFYAFGTPFSGKYDISKNTRAELGGICFISQATENHIERMLGHDAVTLMLEQTLRQLPMESMSRLLDLMDKLLREVGVYRLECNMDISAAKMSYEMMSGERFNG